MNPANFRPAERVAIKGIRFGDRFVEYSERHGTRYKRLLTKSYGSSVDGVLRALADEMCWVETGTLPTD